MVTRSVLVLFNSTQTQALVGKESKWATNTKIMPQEDVDTLIGLFTHESSTNSREAEKAHFTEKITEIPQTIIKQIGLVSEDSPPRITFGDIKPSDTGLGYKTRPVYLPRGTLPNFPGGGADEGESLQNAAVREFKEETGIDISAAPFNIGKLRDTGLDDGTYRVFTYVSGPDEELVARERIAEKNQSPYAELHQLEFLDVGRIVNPKATRQLEFTKPVKTPYVPPFKLAKQSRNFSGLASSSKPRWGGKGKLMKRSRTTKKSRSSKQRWSRTVKKRRF
jgi:8-oxo-dGTP pyrophosphatase MutT (NUDIX family)